MGSGQKSKALEFLKKGYDAFTDAMFPPGYACLGCGKELKSEFHERALCDECAEELPFKTGKLCAVCGAAIYAGRLCRRCSQALPEFDKAAAPFFYDGLAKKFVLDLKARGRLYIADYMAEYMYRYFSASELSADIVTAVPSAAKTLRIRGFDHTELIAKAFSERAHIPYKALLNRIKHKKDQTKLGFSARYASVSGSFEPIRNAVAEGINILLIDDVLTTGATASECARVMKKAGAASVNVITFAR